MVRDPTTEDHPMARSRAKRNLPVKQHHRRTLTTAVPDTTPSDGPKLPGGKLGMIVGRLERKTGATTDELAAITGWQRHTVRGALSRLRSRGFAMQLSDDGARRAYHLDRAGP
jgi:hypothetical protein